MHEVAPCLFTDLGRAAKRCCLGIPSILLLTWQWINRLRGWLLGEVPADAHPSLLLYVSIDSVAATDGVAVEIGVMAMCHTKSRRKRKADFDYVLTRAEKYSLVNASAMYEDVRRWLARI
jgi:hypothetical protein